MELNNLTQRQLKAGVLNNIICKNNHVKQGMGIGNDFSATTFDEKIENNDNLLFISSDGCGRSPFSSFLKGSNNFACSFGKAKWVRINMLLPANSKESTIKNYMKEFYELSQNTEVSIIGGNSVKEALIKEPVFQTTFMGNSKYNLTDKYKLIKSGYRIVFVGFVAALATNQYLNDKNYSVELEQRFSKDFLKRSQFSQDSLFVNKVVKTIMENDEKCLKDICLAHDVSEGGVYRALWQLGEKMNRGFLVYNNLLTIKQETIEICEALNLNPYLCDGSGGLFLVCKDSSKILEILKDKNIKATEIGRVTDNPEKKVYISENDLRTLSPED